MSVAERAAEIGPGRPFYPYRPGGTSQRHLLAAHAVARIDDLRRRCELAGNGRRAACPLFWTLGGNQVGKGAIAGWRDLIAPALRDPSIDLAIWPFDGSLPELFQPGRIVLAETYPGEVYAHLGVDLTRGRSYGRHGKRWQPSRIANASALLGGLEAAQADATQELYRAIETGFGLSEAEEDPFDAVVGLCGMLAVALGLRPNGPPADDAVRRIEGWILGMRADLLPNRPGSA